MTMSIRHSSIGNKLKLLKYKGVNLFSKKNDERINEKIVYLYVKKRKYQKAIKYYENMYSKNKNYYFPLLNLYIMAGNEQKKEALINNYKSSQMLNIIHMMDKLNNTINDFDKINFVKDYLKSKGANPLFILAKNRGKTLKNKSNEEKELLSNTEKYILKRQEWAKSNTPPNYIKNLYKEEQKEKINELFFYKEPIIKATKIMSPDFKNSCVSVENGLRVTKFQPTDYKNKVLIFGSSTTFSCGVSDEDTLASHIQQNLNSAYGDIKVENHGVLGLNFLSAINNMLQTHIEPGDTIVFFDFDDFNKMKDDCIKTVDLNTIDRGNDFFLDLDKYQCHYAPNGNKKVSHYITNHFLTPLINKGEVIKNNYNIIPDDRVFSTIEQFKYFLYKQTVQCFESGAMKEYQDLLDKHKVSPELTVGSIAVNCNPITNGHMHLIQYASSKVDKLYIFVIEEDQSFFKFKDRLKLVEDSTQHIENITVLPGGKFICTELTYPDYFDKEDKTNAITDASMEAWFFCELIAKKLNIKTIFLGDEPTCNVTKQYNEKMQELLPNYGIAVDIIERISTSDRVISASTVRACLKNNDFETIQSLVPKTTYAFLKEKYFH